MSNCDVVFQMGSFNSWCKTHESKADTERQCCMTGLAERAEAAEARADEYAESCGGKVQPNDCETWVECVNRLAGELAIRDEREHAPDIALGQERDELAAQLVTVNTLAHTRLQKIEYLETSLEACRDMQHNAESRVNELQEWYNESVRRNEASAIGAQILENNLNDALAQLATAQAALEQVTQERDAMKDEVKSLRHDLDKHEPIDWPVLTVFQP